MDQLDKSSLDEIIDVMKRQEKADYITKSGIYDQSTAIDGYYRRLMITWCKVITETCDYDDRTVAIAINILDRFVAKQPKILNDDTANNKYQLAAMTCLYITVKIHEKTVLDLPTMEKLSRGSFSSDKFKEMELEILTTLNWRVNPPTAFSFSDMYLELLPASMMDQSKRKIIRKLVKHQINYTIEDCRFLGMASSELAFAATYNATMVTIDQNTRLKAYKEVQRVVNISILPFQLERELWSIIHSNKSLLGKVSFNNIPSKSRLEKSITKSFTKRCHSPHFIALSQ